MDMAATPVLKGVGRCHRHLRVSSAGVDFLVKIVTGVDSPVGEMREDEDLPPAPEPDTDEIVAIMEKTGFLSLVEEG